MNAIVQTVTKKYMSDFVEFLHRYKGQLDTRSVNLRLLNCELFPFTCPMSSGSSCLLMFIYLWYGEWLVIFPIFFVLRSSTSYTFQRCSLFSPPYLTATFTTTYTRTGTRTASSALISCTCACFVFPFSSIFIFFLHNQIIKPLHESVLGKS